MGHIGTRPGPRASADAVGTRQTNKPSVRKADSHGVVLPDRVYSAVSPSQQSGRMYTRGGHSKQLRDWCDRPNCPNYFLQSIFGLISIYNLLPQYVVDAKSVKSFQRKLQEIVTYLAITDYDEWRKCLNRNSLVRSILPRISLDTLSGSLALLPIPRLYRA